MEDKHISRAARFADRTVNVVIVLLLLFALFIGGYAFFDTWQNVQAASQFGSTDPEDIYAEMMARRAENPDVIGWIIVDQTNINYPILKGTDDFDYIGKDWQKNDSGSGSIFMTSGSASDFSDFQTILMGHNMNGGKMFGDVVKFKDQDFFNKHTTARVYLPDRVIELETAVFLEVNASDSSIYGVPQVSEESRALTVSTILGQAINKRADISADDKIVTLSTCSLNNYQDGRYVLVTRVISEEPIDNGSIQ